MIIVILRKKVHMKTYVSYIASFEKYNPLKFKNYIGVFLKYVKNPPIFKVRILGFFMVIPTVLELFLF